MAYTPLQLLNGFSGGVDHHVQREVENSNAIVARVSADLVGAAETRWERGDTGVGEGEGAESAELREGVGNGERERRGDVRVCSNGEARGCGDRQGCVVCGEEARAALC